MQDLSIDVKPKLGESKQEIVDIPKKERKPRTQESKSPKSKTQESKSPKSSSRSSSIKVKPSRTKTSSSNPSIHLFRHYNNQNMRYKGVLKIVKTIDLLQFIDINKLGKLFDGKTFRTYNATLARQSILDVLLSKRSGEDLFFPWFDHAGRYDGDIRNGTIMIKFVGDRQDAKLMAETKLDSYEKEIENEWKVVHWLTNRTREYIFNFDYYYGSYDYAVPVGIVGGERGILSENNNISTYLIKENHEISLANVMEDKFDIKEWLNYYYQVALALKLADEMAPERYPGRDKKYRFLHGNLNPSTVRIEKFDKPGLIAFPFEFGSDPADGQILFNAPGIAVITDMSNSIVHHMVTPVSDLFSLLISSVSMIKDKKGKKYSNGLKVMKRIYKLFDITWSLDASILENRPYNWSFKNSIDDVVNGTAAISAEEGIVFDDGNPKEYYSPMNDKKEPEDYVRSIGGDPEDVEFGSATQAYDSLMMLMSIGDEDRKTDKIKADVLRDIVTGCFSEILHFRNHAIEALAKIKELNDSAEDKYLYPEDFFPRGYPRFRDNIPLYKTKGTKIKIKEIPDKFLQYFDLLLQYTYWYILVQHTRKLIKDYPAIYPLEEDKSIYRLLLPIYGEVHKMEIYFKDLVTVEKDKYDFISNVKALNAIWVKLTLDSKSQSN